MEDTKPENSQTYKLWQYCLDICEYMYNEGLLDRQEFLQSILEMVERCRDPNDPLMRILMPVILQVILCNLQNVTIIFSIKTHAKLVYEESNFNHIPLSSSIPKSSQTQSSFLAN